MQVEEQPREDSNSITHSPYYGCTVRVISKANLSYEGILDGISVNKDRIFLKNVRVQGNINPSSSTGQWIFPSIGHVRIRCYSSRFVGRTRCVEYGDAQSSDE